MMRTLQVKGTQQFGGSVLGILRSIQSTCLINCLLDHNLSSLKTTSAKRQGGPKNTATTLLLGKLHRADTAGKLSVACYCSLNHTVHQVS